MGIKKEESDESTYAKETLGQSNNAEGKCKVLGMAWDHNEDTLELDLTKGCKHGKTN